MTALSAIIRRQLGELERAAPQIRAVLNAVGDPANLTVGQALLLYAATLDLAPDLILDLGTGKGNSASIFALAASRLAHIRSEILTFDMLPSWNETLTTRLKDFRFLGDYVRPVVGDLTRFAFGERLKHANSVVIFWDAHGFDVAEAVLTRVLPASAASAISSFATTSAMRATLARSSPPTEASLCGAE